MRLDEIDNHIRKEKKIIDKLFAAYVYKKNEETRDKLLSHIIRIYPTGIIELDNSLKEYEHLLYDDIFNALKQL